jgi:hypothetical protein
MEEDYEKIHILNSVYSNTIDNEYITKQPAAITKQPAAITTPLYPHQLSLVNAMSIHRNKMLSGFIHGNIGINGKIGIIGDPIGTGKSLSILAYIALDIPVMKNTCELSSNSSKYFFSYDLCLFNDTNYSNLIIVPHILYEQWRQYIEVHTTLSFVAIDTKRTLKDNLHEKIKTCKVVLTTNKCYKSVQQYALAHHIQWNNVFIDDATTIHLQSSDPSFHCQFLWLITSEWYSLLFKFPTINKKQLLYLKDTVYIHPEVEKWLRDDIVCDYTLTSFSFLKEYLPLYHPKRGMCVLRNSMEFIENSMNVPNMINETVECRPNISIQSLIQFFMARNMEPNFQSSKIYNTYQSLNISILHADEYISKQHPDKRNLIMNKIKETDCYICFEGIEVPTIVNCCYNILCGKCILKTILLTHKCPTCRKELAIENITCLSPSIDINYIKTKNEWCLDILQNNPDKQFIIYTAFENIYYQLIENISNLGIKADRVVWDNVQVTRKTINSFKEGKITVLFISNIDMIRGLSLPTTSHLIFYHKLRACELKNVLIQSVQQLGRTSHLLISHLNSEIQV